MNNKQATVAGIKALGYEENPWRSRRYRVFLREDARYALLVGKAGALRRTEGSIDSSVSISGTRTHRALQEVGRRVESGAIESNSPEAHRLFLTLARISK